MGTIVKELIPANWAENTQTVRYTAVNCRGVIDKFTGTNISGTNQALEVWLLEAVDTPGDWNLVVDTKQIGVNDTYTFPELVGHVIGEGGRIMIRASAANAINIRCSGREITS